LLGDDQIVDIQYLDNQGLNKTQIAEELDLHRHTVSKYLEDSEANEDSSRESILDPYKEYLKKRLGDFEKMTATKLAREISQLRSPDPQAQTLLPDQPYDGSERTVQRYVKQIREDNRRVYKPVETLPGEQAQVDWGHFGTWSFNDRQQSLYGFALTLGYSRPRFLRFTLSTSMCPFLECHKRALEYTGGVPIEILYDNCKTVVSERIGTILKFNPDLMRFAEEYGFRPSACWVNDPESKGKVESSLGYAQSDFFYSLPVDEMSLKTLNQKALRWCDEVANENEHSVTREKPNDRLGDEQPALRELPKREVQIYESVSRRIRKDSTFLFETNQYTVPHEYARSDAKLRVTKDTIEVYVDDEDEPVVIHERCHDRGRLILKEDHYEDRPCGARKRKNQLQEEFESLGDIAHDFLNGLANQRNGHLREQARNILDLREEWPLEQIHEAMVRADEFGKYSYGTVKRILNKSHEDPDSLPEDPRKQPSNTNYTGPDIEVQKRTPEDYGTSTEVTSP
jgi:transposase